VNALVRETNDGVLNNIRKQHVKAADVFVAIDSADTGPVADGSVKAGTGTVNFDWNGGIGTSSRRAGGQSVGAACVSGGGWFLHDRGGHRCAHRSQGFTATGLPGHIRVGAHRQRAMRAEPRRQWQDIQAGSIGS